MNKIAFGIASCSFAVAAYAAPELQDYTVEQNADRMVIVSFTLTEKAILTMDVLTNGVSIGTENYQSFRDAMSNVDEFPANKAIAAGPHVFTWRPVREWPGHALANGEFSVEVKAWSFDAPPDYMVIDYDVKSNATFYATAADIPGGIKTAADPGNITGEEGEMLSNDVYRLSKIILRKIPAAGVKWRMGSPETEAYRTPEETQHYVTLTNDYYVAIYPLTRAQCKRFFNTSDANADLSNIYPKSNQSYTGARGAIASYCWPENGHDVAPSSGFEYMRARTGLQFDFLTEAEWEYACRAGTDDSWNGLTEDEVCWHALDTKAANNYPGLKKPNAWGLYDMHGMVNEWVLDQFGEYPDDAVLAPVGVTTNPNLRVLRGGVINWNYNGSWTSKVSTRSAFRHKFDPTKGRTTAPNPFGVRVSCPAVLPAWMR